MLAGLKCTAFKATAELVQRQNSSSSMTKEQDGMQTSALVTGVRHQAPKLQVLLAERHATA
jgi:hypothetical protein